MWSYWAERQIYVQLVHHKYRSYKTMTRREHRVLIKWSQIYIF